MSDSRLERTRTAASQLGRLMMRGLGKMGGAVLQAQAQARLLEARQRAADAAHATERVAVRCVEQAAFATALHRFRPMVEDTIASYKPTVTQADIDGVRRKGHVAVARVLEREILDIIDILTPVMRAAGFPLSSTDVELDAEVTKVWMDARKKLELKAFRHLDLPPYFGFYDGHVGYEPVMLKKGDYGLWGWIGQWSGFRYQSPPALFR